MSLPTPNLMMILMMELSSYLEVHQPDLLPQRTNLHDSIQTFFSRNIFPIAKQWISNLNEVVLEELENHLTLKVGP